MGIALDEPQRDVPAHPDHADDQRRRPAADFFQQDGLHGASPAQFLVSAKEGSRLQKYDEKNGDRRGASGNGVQQPVGAEKEKGKFQRGKQKQIPDFPLFMGRKKCPQLFP